MCFHCFNIALNDSDRLFVIPFSGFDIPVVFNTQIKECDLNLRKRLLPHFFFDERRRPDEQFILFGTIVMCKTLEDSVVSKIMQHEVRFYSSKLIPAKISVSITSVIFNINRTTLSFCKNESCLSE